VEAHLPPEEYRRVWQAKPGLRAVYRDYFRRIGAWCRPGPTVEVGAGAGTLREVLTDVVATDITPSPWVDAVADAQVLPFAEGSVTNLVGVDVLHHIEFPRRFLLEAARVLAPGGRMVVVEPAITPLSWVAFKVAHPEPVDMRADPLCDGTPDPGRHPFDSNQAVPTLLAGRHRARMESAVPDLRLVRRERLSLLAYPLSGGFQQWSLLPSGLADRLLRAERAVEPALAPLMGFRLLLVLVKEPAFPQASVAVSASRAEG
jgi:SAM-dependent methyltransferase